MKAVAAALVLIAGAAVVLWYGNTLNSWVLGGLIGGLAALLLSIPISLMVFSYLSKRHDERLQAEEQDEQGFMEDDYAYERIPARVMRKPREVEGYVITDETPPAVWRDENTYARRVPPALPAPQRTRNSERLSAIQGTSVPAHRAPQDKTRGKETTVLHATTKKIGGTPTFEPSSSISHHRSEALRLARLEAAQQQQDDDVEVLPTHNPKKGMIVRPTQSLAKRNNQGTSIVPPRPATRQQPQPSTRQQRRIVDATGQQDGRRTLSESNDEPIRRLEPSTDAIEGSYPQTGPLRRGSQGGRSRETTQEHEQRSGADSTHGSANKPLVRRAPYMYDDDPLRQELAQHLEAPMVRRSSRFDEDDEND
jgi:hypothetical protein